MSLMKIIKNAFEGDSLSTLPKEASEGDYYRFGRCQSTTIRGRIAYDGRYGEFTDEPYYKDGNLTI